MRAVSGLLVGACLLAAGCGEDGSVPTTVHLVVPDGLDARDLSLLPCRRDTVVIGWEASRQGHAVVLRVPGNEPFDLQVGCVPDSALEQLFNAGHSVYSLGDYEGWARGIVPGSGDAVVVVRRIVPCDVSLRVKDTEGRPVQDAGVVLRSLADCISGDTDADGACLLREVPVRDWLLVVRPPPSPAAREGDEPPHVLFSRRFDLEAGTSIDVVLPRGVPIELRTSRPLDVPALLSVQELGMHISLMRPWPTADPERMVLYVNPEWSVCSLLLMTYPDSSHTARTLAQGSVDPQSSRRVVLSVQ